MPHARLRVTPEGETASPDVRFAEVFPGRLSDSDLSPRGNSRGRKSNQTASAEAAHTTTESPVRGDSLQVASAARAADVAPAMKNARTAETRRTVDSTLAASERVTSEVTGKARGTQSVKPATVSVPAPARRAKQLSAHFGQSEIVDPWGMKR